MRFGSRALLAVLAAVLCVLARSSLRAQTQVPGNAAEIVARPLQAGVKFDGERTLDITH